MRRYRGRSSAFSRKRGEAIENQGLLSIIIPVYNGAPFLGSAVGSILHQTYRPLEIILVDDGSTDDTSYIADRLRESTEGLLRYFYQPNAGPATARNYGLERAGGEFVSFLDADDLWPENSLEVRLAALQSDPALGGVMGRVRLFGSLEPAESGTFLGSVLGAGLFRRSVFDQVGTFDPTLRFSEDVDWFLRAQERSISIRQIDTVTLLYRRHEASLTHQKSLADLQLLQVLKRSIQRRRSIPIPELSVETRATRQEAECRTETL